MGVHRSSLFYHHGKYRTRFISCSTIYGPEQIVIRDNIISRDFFVDLYGGNRNW